MKWSPERITYNQIRKIIDLDENSLSIDYQKRVEEIKKVLEKTND